MPADDDAAIGIRDERLAAIVREHWAQYLRDEPVFATRVGMHAYDDRLPDRSADGIAARRAARDGFIARLEALPELAGEDRVHAAVLLADLRGDAAQDVCRFEQWNVSVTSNALERYGDLPRRPATQAEADALVRRWNEIPRAIDLEIERLRAGAAEGLYASRNSLTRTLELLDRQLRTPLNDWTLMRVKPAPGVTVDVEPIVADAIVPALRRYREFLLDELLPRSRAQEGLASMPSTDGCYEALVQHHTTLPLPPGEVHEIGLAEIARLDQEIAALGAKLFGTNGLAATLEHLRSDRSLYFATGEEVAQAASDSLAAAKVAMPGFFGRLPQADCVVELIPRSKASFTTIAYYEPPHADGSKPGEYFINVVDAKTRPKFEARVLAVHESIPGHHLQIAIAQELEGLPAFRRHTGFTVFVEGWALYTERLADEMGLYQSDLDRMGMLSFDAWRAGRLVVDTGIHFMGWSRREAEQFLAEHTALTPQNISNEIDRYIAWPGQALGYKIGQLEIWKLRREAERELGDRFDLASFHDTVLGGGSVTIPVLRERVAAWVAARR